MQPPRRCPRCGYPLAFDARGYRCEFCGFPQRKPPLLNSIINAGRGLRQKMQAALDKGRGQYRVIVQYPVGQATCSSCGLRMPYGVPVCPYCSAPQRSLQPTPPIAPPMRLVEAQDQAVLDYIVARNGTISISQAARDLSISQEVLRSTIERLKASGLLRPT